MPDRAAWPSPTRSATSQGSLAHLPWLLTLRSRRVVGRTLLATVILGAMPAAAAQAQTFATITPTLSPNHPRAKAALTLTIHYTGGESGLPSPVRRAVLRFPAGLTLDIPSLHSCSAARLRAEGPHGCPKQSRIGTGQALVEANLGAQTVTEDVTLNAFLGPLRNLQPTFEILAQGSTPFDEQVLLIAVALPDRPPYGEKLAISIPAIPTLSGGSDASIADFSLTVGASGRHRDRNATTVLVPRRCPAGGFPFAAQFTYADASTSSATAKVRCPS